MIKLLYEFYLDHQNSTKVIVKYIACFPSHGAAKPDVIIDTVHQLIYIWCILAIDTTKLTFLARNMKNKNKTTKVKVKTKYFTFITRRNSYLITVFVELHDTLEALLFNLEIPYE